jgi:anti-sigma regulatory factor (Ser/Thr protein kinase)
MCTPGRIIFSSHPPGRSWLQIMINVHPAGPSWLRMQPSPEFVLQARRFTAKLLTECDPGFIDDAELVTSELVTNSLNYALSHGDPPRHVAGGIWLGVQLLRRYCRIYVRDPFPVLPTRRKAAEDDISGRGLLIVEMLSAAYWVSPRAYDKTLHAVIAKPGVVLTEAELDRLRR